MIYKLPKAVDFVIILSSLKFIHNMCTLLWINQILWISIFINLGAYFIFFLFYTSS